jgi:integrase
VAKRFDILTRPNMRKLAPGQKLTEHGIRYEKLEDHDGRFSVWFRANGEVVHRVIGRESEGFTRTHAEEFIEQTKSDARKGELNLPKGRKAPLVASKAIDKYLNRLEESGGRDLKNKKQAFRDYLGKFFGSKRLDQITTFDVERYKKHRQGQGASNGTINRELAYLSHMLNRALEWGWLNGKVAVIRKLPEEQGRIVYLTTEQCTRILKAAKNNSNPQLYLFVRIGLDTGMRLSEILSIRLENIHLERHEIYIPKAKAGARVQPISKSLAGYLQLVLDGSEAGQEWLFPSIGNKKSKCGHTVDFRTSWKEMLKQASLDDDIVRHTLRHTAITHLVQAGVDLPTVKQISGHKTLQMVERYSHRNSDHINAALDKLSERVSKDQAGCNRNATETKKGSSDETLKPFGAGGQSRTDMPRGGRF